LQLLGFRLGQTYSTVAPNPLVFFDLTSWILHQKAMDDPTRAAKYNTLKEKKTTCRLYHGTQK